MSLFVVNTATSNMTAVRNKAFRTPEAAFSYVKEEVWRYYIGLSESYDGVTVTTPRHRGSDILNISSAAMITHFLGGHFGEYHDYRDDKDSVFNIIKRMRYVRLTGTSISEVFNIWWTISEISEKYTETELIEKAFEAIRKDGNYAEDDKGFYHVIPPEAEFKVSEIVDILNAKGGPEKFLEESLHQEYDPLVSNEEMRIRDVVEDALKNLECEVDVQFIIDSIMEVIDVSIPLDAYKAQKIKLLELLEAAEDESGMNDDEKAKMPVIRNVIGCGMWFGQKGETVMTLGEIIKGVEDAFEREEKETFYKVLEEDDVVCSLFAVGADVLIEEGFVLVSKKISETGTFRKVFPPFDMHGNILEPSEDDQQISAKDIAKVLTSEKPEEAFDNLMSEMYDKFISDEMERLRRLVETRIMGVTSSVKEAMRATGYVMDRAKIDYPVKFHRGQLVNLEELLPLLPDGPARNLVEKQISMISLGRPVECFEVLMLGVKNGFIAP